MKITKQYLKQLIKEELTKVITEGGERYGEVYFDQMATSMAHGAEVDLENLAHQLSQLLKGQPVNITMDDSGIRMNGNLVGKDNDQQAFKNFAHNIKSRLNKQFA